ncbi:MAG: hypothetical protein ACXQS8_06445 [Candidatus Helarchaeales archaeon]
MKKTGRMLKCGMRVRVVDEFFSSEEHKRMCGLSCRDCRELVGIVSCDRCVAKGCALIVFRTHDCRIPIWALRGEDGKDEKFFTF